MPDIDPAALSRTDSVPHASTTTPTVGSKTTAATGSSAQKASKPAPSAPRVDVEPLYTALKSAIGDQWGQYKDAFSRFVLGHLNQEELSREIDPIIGPDPNREHLHNQLVCAIFANALRDPPEQGVASWVSANDKPTSVSKPLSGDAAEQRLKFEVMQLPPRVRHRLKSIQDEPYNPFTHAITIHSAANKRHYHGSSPAQASGGAANTPTSGASLSKDTEIRRRYNIPLISESNDLPPSQLLTDRLLPICYEEGLASGPSAPQSCADLLSTALESFVKEMVVDIISRAQHNAPISGPDASIPSSSAPGATVQPGTATSTTSVAPTASVPGTTTTGVMTALYKRQLTRETAAEARGDLKRSETGLLPAELAAAAAQRHGRGLPGDLRVAWEMEDPWLGSMLPWMGERIRAGDGSAAFPLADLDILDALIEADVADATASLTSATATPAPKLNGDAAAIPNGVNGANGAPHEDDSMSVDEPSSSTGIAAAAPDAADAAPDWGWQGTAAPDRDALGALLDDCLAVGE